MNNSMATRPALTSRQWRGLVQMIVSISLLVAFVIADFAYATPPPWGRALPSIAIFFFGLNWLLWPHDNTIPAPFVARLLGIALTLAGCFSFFRIISSF